MSVFSDTIFTLGFACCNSPKRLCHGQGLTGANTIVGNIQGGEYEKVHVRTGYCCTAGAGVYIR